MDVFDAIDRYWSPIVEYLSDLGLFFSNPGDYLRLTATEPLTESVARFATYAVGYAVLQILMLAATGIGEVSFRPSLIFGISLLEVVFGVFYVPAFWLVALYLDVSERLKAAFSYCLTYRFALFPIPILFYGLFLATESYGFAIIRGVTAHFILIASIFVFPLCLADTWKHKLVSSGIAVLTTGLTFIAIANLSAGQLGRHSSFKQMSLFYDPIASEVTDIADSAESVRRTGLQSRLRAWTRRIRSWSGDEYPAIAARAESVQQNWNDRRSELLSEMKSSETHLEEELTKAQFGRSKALIRLELEEVKRSTEVLHAVDRVVRDSMYRGELSYLRSVSRMMERITELQDAQIRSLREWRSYVSLVVKLRRWRLITY